MPRITLRLSEDLYARLLLFARGRNGVAPEVSQIMREALEQYLSGAKRQTRSRHSVRQKGKS